MDKRCTCGKLCHPTRKRAELQGVKDQLRRSDLSPMFVYLCNKSGMWHTTREPQTADQARDLAAYKRRVRHG